jgi:hypothetical protein
MKKLLVVLLLVSSAVRAESLYYNDNVIFDAQDQYKSVTIYWHIANDVKQACNMMNAMSHQPYNDKMVACASRVGDRCDIYTEHKLDLAILGHEVRHCYEGAWHD